MSNNYKDPELIRLHGDDIEQQFAEQILTRIPSYATFWATYVGNDGSHHSLPMPGASTDAHKSRDEVWQNLYTLFESLALCWFLENQFGASERIQTADDYFRNLNAWTAFYAHLGRIHDMAEKTTTILGEKRLFAPFDPFYEQRHIALHGIKVPMRWADSVLCAPPLGEEANQWHTQMAWKDLKKAQFDYLSASVSSTLRALEPVIAGFFDAALKLAEPRLGLRPVAWPENLKPRSADDVVEIPMAGTQSCQVYAVESPKRHGGGYSGISPLAEE